MYAIVEVLGEQVKAVPGKEMVVPYMSDKKDGDEITVDKVMLISNEGDQTIGKPIIDGASVKALIIEHFRDDKVIVFKKKRRTGYHKKQGHRQNYTKLMVKEIISE